MSTALEIATNSLGHKAKEFISYWDRTVPEAWCVDFVGYCVDNAGYRLTRPFWGNVDNLASRLMTHGWQKSSTPHAGDVFIEPRTHTGIVAAVTAKGIETIEGNTERSDNWANESVKRLTRKTWSGYYFLSPPAAPATPATPATPAAPKPSAKTVEELAREVIRGNWGNGQARKDAITKAGYNYTAVQKKVNELLK